MAPIRIDIEDGRRSVQPLEPETIDPVVVFDALEASLPTVSAAPGNGRRSCALGDSVCRSRVRYLPLASARDPAAARRKRGDPLCEGRRHDAP